MDQHKPFRLSVKALIRDAAGRVLVLRRSAASRFNAGHWDFPGGKIDLGEGMEEAFRREVREETGLNVTLVRVLGAGESQTPEFRVAYLFFEGRVTGSAQPILPNPTDPSDSDDPTEAAPITIALSSEHDAAKWVSPSELAFISLCPQYNDPVLRRLTSDSGQFRKVL